MLGTDADPQACEVDDLGRRELLSAFGDAERRDREAQLDKLQLGYQWAVMKPGALDDAATWGDGQRGSAGDCDEPIGGEGSPLVAPAAVPALGAAWGVSMPTAQSLIADAIDLRHRLPRIWAMAERLELAPWKARRIASMTRSLSAQAAGWVDTDLAARLPDAGFPTIDRVIRAAVAVFHPERIDLDPKSDKDLWHVDLTHSASDTVDNAHLDVTADTLDLVAFYDLVCRVADALRRLGDEDTLDQRKAKAVGLIGRGDQHDLLAEAASSAPHDGDSDPDSDPDPDPDSDPDSGTGVDSDTDVTDVVAKPRRRWTPRRPGGPTKVYVHVNASDLDDLDEPAPPTTVGYVERIGAATVDRIREWVGRPGVRIQPVLHMDATDAVDCHDPPEWMAELVRLRDPHCVFPGCQRSSRSCDLDHIKPHRPHGPPGQTRPENLAPLCRGHHNAKTHLGWRYQRMPDGTYHWTSPDGLHYVVDVRKDLHLAAPPIRL